MRKNNKSFSTSSTGNCGACAPRNIAFPAPAAAPLHTGVALKISQARVTSSPAARKNGSSSATTATCAANAALTASLSAAPLPPLPHGWIAPPITSHASRTRRGTSSSPPMRKINTPASA